MISKLLARNLEVGRLAAEATRELHVKNKTHFDDAMTHHNYISPEVARGRAADDELLISPSLRGKTLPLCYTYPST